MQLDQCFIPAALAPADQFILPISIP